MDKFNRAVRRHHIARLKHNRKNYHGYGTGRNAPPVTPKFLGKMVQYPKMCSCTMCGNPRRKLKGKSCLTNTMQQNRQDARESYELLEVIS